jgi:hypothetical protein
MLLMMVVLPLAGCGEDAPPTRQELFVQQMELPTLYLTAETYKEVVAPANKGVFVDADTGELCWAAQQCHNPECPGREDGNPFLFIIPLAGVTATAQGTVASESMPPKPGLVPPSPPGSRSSGNGLCPACLKERNMAAETPEQRQQYINWVRPHVLPEAAEQKKQIEQQRKKMADKPVWN